MGYDVILADFPQYSQTKIESASSAITAVSDSSGVGSHFLVRILFLRCFSLLYSIVFIMALRQNKALIGDNGITPARNVLNNLEETSDLKRKRHDEWWQQQRKRNHKTDVPYLYGGGVTPWQILKSTKLGQRIGTSLNDSKMIQNLREVFLYRSDNMGLLYPTILWFISKEDRNNNLDVWLDRIAITGLMVSILIFILGAANVPLMLVLWICQRSIMSVGGPWYAFGWEIQLSELTFHAAFLVPMFSLAAIPYSTPVPIVSLWAMRWFLFRIMIGAGLIKLRSNDEKWKNLTTMNFFYETQPVPNPLSRYFHKMPTLWHKCEVLINHFVELIAPWSLIIPFLSRRYRILGGIIQMIFQIVIIASGNLSFLNWLTMLPALYCFDDLFVSNLFSTDYVTSASIAAYNHSAGIFRSNFRHITDLCFGTLIATLSIPVIKNLISKKQIMNGSFDPLRLVNTYGAFGTVQEERIELIFESAVSPDGPWREYQFKVKPGDLERNPRFISPYHYRLDWLLWIAAVTGDIERNPWMYHFLEKLLSKDARVLNLIDTDPWHLDGKRPKFIRIMKYKYKFANLGGDHYWKRELIEQYFPKEGQTDVESLKKMT